MSDRRRKAGRRGDRAARQARVRQIADVLRDYTASPFQYEAACRHGLRAQLCLNGWDWHDADAEAHKLVQAALDMIGARRPSWWLGQPDAAREGVRAHERTSCARCGKRLPDDARFWCSDVCRSAGKADRQTRDDLDRMKAAKRVRNAAWSEKQPERTCQECGVKFKPKDKSNPGQRFCSQTCGSKWAGREYKRKAA